MSPLWLVLLSPVKRRNFLNQERNMHRSNTRENGRRFQTHKMCMISQDVNWWTGVVWINCGLLWCFYQLFGLSFWWHPFTVEHPNLFPWKNKHIIILEGLRVSKFSTHFYFWMGDISKAARSHAANNAVASWEITYITASNTLKNEEKH